MHNISESTDAFYILLAFSILTLVALVALCFLMAAVLKALLNDKDPSIQEQLLLIIQNQKTMSEAADQIKQALADAQAKVTKVAADVALLHSKIDALSTSPTPEEVAEIKTLAADLNSSLQTVDDATPEETTPVG